MAENGEEVKPNIDEDRAMTDISTPVKHAHEVLRHVAVCSSTKIIERELLKEVILEDKRRFAGCLMLPITLSFFTLFSISSIMHEDVAYKHMVDFPVRNALNPLLDEDSDDPGVEMLDGLNSIDDVWTYLSDTFVPYFFRQTDANGQEITAAAKGEVLNYNEVLGGIKLTLFRGVKTNCSDPFMSYLTCFPQAPGSVISTEQYGGNISQLFSEGKDNAYWLNGPDAVLRCADEGFINCGTLGHGYCFGGGCYVNSTLPSGDWNGEEFERPQKIDLWNLDRRLAPLREELLAKMPVAQSAMSAFTEGPKNFEFRLPINNTYEKTMARLHYLKDRGWLDEQTLQMTVDVTTFNYQLAYPRLCNVKFTFFFSRGGGIFTQQAFEVSPLKTFDDKSVILFDLLFIITVGLSGLYIAKEFAQDMKSGRLIGHFKVANVIIWLSCLVGFLHICGLALRFMMQKTVMATLENFIIYQDDYAQDAVVQASANVNMTSSLFRVFQTVAYILFMFRVFLSLGAQPRMGIITKTLAGTTVDLFHFILVLFPTWFGFASAGHLMFGRRVQYFSTLTSSFCFCLQLMLEGEYDWAMLSAEDFWFVVFWVWTYMVLMVLVMLNICLAIIMDTFSEISRQQGETMTLWGHCGYLINRAIYFKQWVPDMDVWERVNEMPQNIVIDELREAFPFMPAPQIDFLVKASNNAVRIIQRKGIDAAYTVQMLAAIHISLEEVVNDLAKLKRRGWMGKGLEVQNDAERDLVKEILSGISMQTHWMNLTQEQMSKIYQKVGMQELPTTDWKLVNKAEVAAPPVRQGND